MTVADIITAARTELKDTVAEYRWPDTTMLPFVSDGHMEIASNHRESMCSDAIVTALPVPLTATTDTLLVADHYKQALVAFTCARCLQMDQENAANLAAAANYATQYKTLVGG